MGRECSEATEFCAPCLAGRHDARGSVAVERAIRCEADALGQRAAVFASVVISIMAHHASRHPCAMRNARSPACSRATVLRALLSNSNRQAFQPALACTLYGISAISRPSRTILRTAEPAWCSPRWAVRILVIRRRSLAAGTGRPTAMQMAGKSAHATDQRPEAFSAGKRPSSTAL